MTERKGRVFCIMLQNGMSCVLY